MANTYSQLYIQFVFAVKHRQALITPNIKLRVEQYICGIVTNCECKPIALCCNPDHTHLFVSLKPKISCSELAQKVKGSTSHFINENGLTENHFEWQVGFGAFSYGKSQTDAVCHYINNQEKHHETLSFEEEYIALLKIFDIEYDRKYLFECHCR